MTSKFASPATDPYARHNVYGSGGASMQLRFDLEHWTYIADIIWPDGSKESLMTSPATRNRERMKEFSRSYVLETIQQGPPYTDVSEGKRPAPAPTIIYTDRPTIT